MKKRTGNLRNALTPVVRQKEAREKEGKKRKRRVLKARGGGLRGALERYYGQRDAARNEMDEFYYLT